ncbi:MAG TPA: cadmium-translocating P-type ATPase [Gammaproteobacteria bacterium]|nr:cadmium-translocating P-type ATPase [Gammaproteobacteria bacterium]
MTNKNPNTLTYHINGMDCPDCAAKVKKVADRLAGVENLRVDFTTGKLSAKVTSPEAADQLRDTVESLGYTLHDASQPVTSVLRVENLDCSEEVSLIEKMLGHLPGLVSLDANPVTQRLAVVHDPEQLPLGQIIAALAEAKLTAVPFGEARVKGGFWTENGALVAMLSAAVLVALGLTLHHVLGAGAGAVWAKLAFGSAILAGGWPIARKAWAAAHHGAIDMNVLMSVAVIGALFIDAWDEGAMVVFLFSLAQWLESRSMDRARNAVRALMELAPPVARVLREGHEVTVAVEQVQVGEIIRLRPGDKAPLDGEVVDGHSALNQAPITGESLPVEKTPGDTVYAGSINGQGSLDLRVTHLAADTTLAHIIHLIEEAQAARAPTQTFIDRFARVYTPAVLLLAALIAVLPPLLFGQAFDDWFYRALVLLVIACPCALVISTPVAIVSGLARGARAGVLIKGGIHLENIGHLRALAFDKTGTLTEGRPKVQDVETLGDTPAAQLLRIAASLEARSEHPLAQAILEHAAEAGITPDEVSDFQARTGRGVQARIDGRYYQLGNHRLFEERGLCGPAVKAVLDRREAEGKTVIILGDEQHVLGLISIADQPRANAREAIARLRALGIQNITLLTGDNRGAARAIAGHLGIDAPRAELLPADKVEAVKALVARHQRVGMVGDGVNDAPAMAAATTGIAMGAAGSDVALETADLVLMGDDLARLPFAIRLSRASLRVIHQNIAMALGLKAIFLALAIPGYATLWMAVFADMGASLLVIANSLRLLRLR